MGELSGKKMSGGKIGDDAVIEATGREWKEWFSILDKAGGKKMSHKELVAHLNQFHDARPWWRQMIAVQYEFKRGLREKHQTPAGYQISRSKTINAPLDDLYNAFIQKSIRKKWLPDNNITITTSHENKSIRGKWLKDITIEVNFYNKGKEKTQVVVQNNKINSLAEAEKLKTYWEQALIKLADIGKK